MADGKNAKINEEDVRQTAYFLWEQAGHPDSDPADFWARALEQHQRAHMYGQELEAGLATQRALNGSGPGESEAPSSAD